MYINQKEAKKDLFANGFVKNPNNVFCYLKNVAGEEWYQCVPGKKTFTGKIILNAYGISLYNDYALYYEHLISFSSVDLFINWINVDNATERGNVKTV